MKYLLTQEEYDELVAAAEVEPVSCILEQSVEELRSCLSTIIDQLNCDIPRSDIIEYAENGLANSAHIHTGATSETS